MISVEWSAAPTGADLAAIAALISEFDREVIPDEPDFPVDELAGFINHRPRYRRSLIAVASEDGELVGSAELGLQDLDGRRHIGSVESLIVRPDRRRRGIARALLDAVMARARQEGRVRLDGYAPVALAPGMTFASATGATPGLVDRQNRLRVTDLSRVTLENWVDRAQDRARGYSLVSFDGLCPDKWLVGFASVVGVMNTAPQSQPDDDVVVTPEQIRDTQEAMLRRGGSSWTVCARHDASDELVGLSEIFFSEHRPWLGFQGDTGVDPAHRDRGLGRWLKAVNALRLLDERPEIDTIETWNAGINAAMLSINDAMGFRPVAEWQEWNLAVAS